MTKHSLNPKPKISMTSGEVLHCLRRMFKPEEWLIAEELYIPGFNSYVDFWAIKCAVQEPIKGWPKKGFEFLAIHAVEVKVSKSDFKAEIENPNKRMGAVMFSNYYSIACPRGLIQIDELPEEVGLIEIQGVKPVFIKLPSYSRAEPPGWDFIASLGRALK